MECLKGAGLEIRIYPAQLCEPQILPSRQAPDSHSAVLPQSAKSCLLPRVRLLPTSLAGDWKASSSSWICSHDLAISIFVSKNSLCILFDVLLFIN